MTMKNKNTSLWIAVAAAGLALTLAACGKDKGGDQPARDPAAAPAADPAKPAGEPAAEPAPQPAAKDSDAAGLTGVLEQYEQIRAQLASDDVESAVAGAAKLESAAESAVGSAPAATKTHLEQVATASGEMAEVAATDADAVRKAFGEVSKPMVELLSAAPELREGWHVFECPMAPGYKKWVQPTAELANPYMGTEMLTCGSEADWPAGG